MKIVNTSGKRKTAVARATIKKGTGIVRINSIPLEIYTPEIARLKIFEPIQLAGSKAKHVDIVVDVHGGGVMGQADAVRTAIGKGFVEFFKDEKIRETYLAYDRNLFVSDTRVKEPKHQLGRGARKKRQKSYR